MQVSPVEGTMIIGPNSKEHIWQGEKVFQCDPDICAHIISGLLP